MKIMKIWRIAIAMLAALSLTSCGSDEPQWADPEAHEKTEQLREQYTPYIVGTWYYEETIEKQRAFERITFFAGQSGKAERNADGTLNGRRKWQSRKIVTIDGQEQYTDWEDIPDENGTFTGTWNLVWERNSSGVGENRIILYALWDDEDRSTSGRLQSKNPIIAYSHNPLFGYADATTLQFAGHWQNSDGWTIYERGEAEPSF